MRWKNDRSAASPGDGKASCAGQLGKTPMNRPFPAGGGRFALDIPLGEVDNAAGWFSERVSVSRASVVGCLCLFQPHLLAGLHSWPLSLQP
jgi:hypothetical protein